MGLTHKFKSKEFLAGWMTPAQLVEKLSDEECRLMQYALIDRRGMHTDEFACALVLAVENSKMPSDLKLYASLLLRTMAKTCALSSTTRARMDAAGIDRAVIEAEPEDVPTKKKVNRVRIEDDDEDDDGDHPITSSCPKVRV